MCLSLPVLQIAVAPPADLEVPDIVSKPLDALASVAAKPDVADHEVQAVVPEPSGVSASVTPKDLPKEKSVNEYSVAKELLSLSRGETISLSEVVQVFRGVVSSTSWNLNDAVAEFIPTLYDEEVSVPC